MRKKTRVLWWAAVPLTVVALVILFHSWWLAALGNYLVLSDPPVKADVGVVLAGDFSGSRILTGCELAREGYVSTLLISGPSGTYGNRESDLAISFAVKNGCNADWLIPVPNDARSTRQEAAAIIPVMRERGVKSYLLITSNYHTRRATRVYARAAPDLEVHTVDAPDIDFDPNKWWKSRQGEKVFLYESLKMVADWLGI